MSILWLPPLGLIPAGAAYLAYLSWSLKRQDAAGWQRYQRDRM